MEVGAFLPPACYSLPNTHTHTCGGGQHLHSGCSDDTPFLLIPFGSHQRHERPHAVRQLQGAEHKLAHVPSLVSGILPCDTRLEKMAPSRAVCLLRSLWLQEGEASADSPQQACLELETLTVTASALRCPWLATKTGACAQPRAIWFSPGPLV